MSNIMIKTIITTISLTLALFTPAISHSADLDWLLDCSYSGENFDYFKEIEKLRRDSDRMKEITAELNRQLRKTYIVLNENSACIYAPVLYFGDESTVRYFRARVKAPLKYDKPGYANDILTSLTSGSKQFNTKPLFIKMIKSFKNPTATEYFLEIHLQELPFQSRMEVMTYVVHNNKLPGYHGYAAPDIMEKLYKEDSKAYDAYIKSLPQVPEEFICFKNNTCP